LRHGPHLRSLLWHIYTRTLPIPRGTLNSSCPSCGERESTLHIFFTRSAVSDLVNHIAPLYTFTFNRPLEWSPSNILTLETPRGCSSSLHLLFVATTFRLLWLRRNKLRHQEPLPPFRGYPAILKAEMARYITAKWGGSACINSVSTTTPHFHPAHSSHYFHLIRAFESRWLIPKFFTLQCNYVVPSHSQ
jgi:hypothetical protein